MKKQYYPELPGVPLMLNIMLAVLILMVGPVMVVAYIAGRITGAW